MLRTDLESGKAWTFTVFCFLIFTVVLEDRRVGSSQVSLKGEESGPVDKDGFKREV